MSCNMLFWSRSNVRNHQVLGDVQVHVADTSLNISAIWGCFGGVLRERSKSAFGGRVFWEPGPLAGSKANTISTWLQDSCFLFGPLIYSHLFVLPKKSGHEFFSVGDLFRDKQEQWGVKHSGDNLTGPGPQNVVISVEIIQISMVDWVNPNTRQYSKFGNFWYSGIMICWKEILIDDWQLIPCLKFFPGF